MKEYRVIVYRENALSSLVFGSAKANPVKFTDFLNQNAQDGWRVVTMDRDIQRMFLFFRREAYLVILERDK
ncbi:MAG: DUF4177 domain-containing protein [Rickettsiales bacterium]|jgi:hypothetical protein|nr:DUF4177 domain-containing protein [Rickettsiales bacterium]